jgi:hypothetical protein
MRDDEMGKLKPCSAVEAGKVTPGPGFGGKTMKFWTTGHAEGFFLLQNGSDNVKLRSTNFTAMAGPFCRSSIAAGQSECGGSAW